MNSGRQINEPLGIGNHAAGQRGDADLSRNKMRILAIRGGAIGDFVLTLPALRAVRVTFPDAFIEIMGYPAVADLALQRYYADAVSRVDAADMAPLFVPHHAIPQAVAARLSEFHTAICFWKDDSDILAANLRRVGIPKVYAVNPFPNRREHAAAHMLEALAPLVGKGHDPFPRIFLNDRDRSFAEDFLTLNRLQPVRMSLFAVHAGSGGKHKRWPAADFAALMAKAAVEWRARWLVVCGPADEEVCDDLRKALLARDVGALTWARGLTLAQVAALLSVCRAYVGNDSGITHLAAAVGTPTVAVFGPTDPVVWGPRPRVRGRSQRVSIVASPVPAAPWPSADRVWQALAAVCWRLPKFTGVPVRG